MGACPTAFGLQSCLELERFVVPKGDRETDLLRTPPQGIADKDCDSIEVSPDGPDEHDCWLHPQWALWVSWEGPLGVPSAPFCVGM